MFTYKKGRGKQRGPRSTKPTTSGKAKRFNAAVTKYGSGPGSVRPQTITVRVPRNMSGTSAENKYYEWDDTLTRANPNRMEWDILQDTVPNKSYLNAVVAGTGVANRIGNKIHVKKIVIKLSVSFPQDTSVNFTTGEHSQKFKFALMLDQQANGGIPTTYPWDTSIQDKLDFMAFTKVDNTRFRILKTKVVQRKTPPMVDLAGTAYVQPLETHEMVLKHKFAGDGLVMTFDSPTSVIPRDNALYLVNCSNTNVDIGPIYGAIRLYFKG